jgi:hypothetical protein
MQTAAAIVLFCLWPFHRVSSAPPENVSTITVVGAEDETVQDRQGCETTPDGFLYLGEDAMVGISRVSCEAAFQAWRYNPPPKIWLYHA